MALPLKTFSIAGNTISTICRSVKQRIMSFWWMKTFPSASPQQTSTLQAEAHLRLTSGFESIRRHAKGEISQWTNSTSRLWWWYPARYLGTQNQKIFKRYSRAHCVLYNIIYWYSLVLVKESASLIHSPAHQNFTDMSLVLRHWCLPVLKMT